MDIALGVAVAVAMALLWRTRQPWRRGGPLLSNTGDHWRRNYSRRSFLKLGGAAVASAALAYSGADEALQTWHGTRVRSRWTDRLAAHLHHYGERFWFVVWGAVAGVDAYVRTSSFSRWGRQNFEAMLVGLPVLWTVQRGLGANRPSDPDPNPRWRPLADDNAASGHAFIAGIPWLNLARRLPPGVGRGVARVLSTATGWSRLNDDKHYLSQVLLGWVIAWNATAAVADTPSVALVAGQSTAEELAVAEPDPRPR